MQFIEIIESLLKNKNVLKKDFLEKMELNKNSFSDWKKRKNLPTGDVLIEFADYFSVSVDYILGLTDNPQVAQPQGEKHITNEKGNEEMDKDNEMGNDNKTAELHKK